MRFLDLGVRATPGHVQLQVRASEGRAHVDLHAAGLAEAISGSVGLRVCRTLATAQGGRLDGPTQDRLSFSLPLRVGRRGLPAGLVDARFL